MWLSSLEQNKRVEKWNVELEAIMQLNGVKEILLF
jgi:hypothetical protein